MAGNIHPLRTSVTTFLLPPAVPSIPSPSNFTRHSAIGPQFSTRFES